MTFEREDYQRLVEERGKEKLNGQRQNLEYLRQAAVKADLLTGDQAWDVYLSYLEAAREAFSDDLESAKAHLCDPQRVDPQEIMGLKMQVARLGERIAILEAVMTLPSDIKKQGDKAKDLLKRLNG